MRRLLIVLIALISVAAALIVSSTGAWADVVGLDGETSGTVSSGPDRVDVSARSGGGSGGSGSSGVSRGGVVVCEYSEVPNLMAPAEESSGPLGAGDLEEGRFYMIRCERDGERLYDWRVFQHDPAVPAPVSPLALAQQASDMVEPSAPSVAHNPAGVQLAGFATWWWVDEEQWEPVSASASVPGLAVTATATPVRVTWTPGDDSDPVVCDGPGVPYDPAVPMSHQDTDCRHVYQFFGVYEASAMIDWQVAWAASTGESGTLADLSTTTTFEIRVAERQAVGRPG